METHVVVQLDPIPKHDEVAAHRLNVIQQYLNEFTADNGDRLVFHAPHTSYDSSDADQAIKELTAEADFLLTLRRPIPAKLIEQASRVRLIQKLGFWYDNIDLQAAAARQIPVAVSPHYGVVNVAEHTLLLMLALSRQLLKLHAATATAQNPKALPPLYTTQWQRYFNWMGLPGDDFATLFGRTLGLVGLGEIGGEVARRARAFGMTLLYTKRQQLTPAQEEALGLSFVPLDELLQRADYVSLHLPQTAETEKMIARRELALMKPTAFLINTSRGNLVDEAALVNALQEGQIAGAGLDVFSCEPIQPDNPLTQLQNVVLTPHVGAVAPMINRYRPAFENMRRVLEGQPILDRIA